MQAILDGISELWAEYGDAILQAFWVNVKLTFWAAVFAFILGTILMIMRVSPAPSLRWAATTYVNVVRSIPLTLIILACSQVLFGQLQIILADQDVPGWLATNNMYLAILGLSLYTASFVCEALRSGINTVPQGQAEAARAIGLGFGQVMYLVILPQAIRGSIAPLGSTLVALTKNSTVAQAAGVTTAAGIMSTAIEFRPDIMVAIFLLFAIGWVILVLPVGMLSTYLSKKLAVAR
ncbi:ABC-type amino acid transport system, permease component [Actinomycetales bacterium JB111]|nr:ABC-type amino acid transport system, permease component [Actinomycetales bacterium JB111]